MGAPRGGKRQAKPSPSGPSAARFAMSKGPPSRRFAPTSGRRARLSTEGNQGSVFERQNQALGAGLLFITRFAKGKAKRLVWLRSVGAGLVSPSWYISEPLDAYRCAALEVDFFEIYRQRKRTSTNVLSSCFDASWFQLC